MTQPVALEAGDGEALVAAGTSIVLKLRSAATGGRFSVAEYALPAGFAGPPPHVHRSFEHAVHVLEGEAVFGLGDGEFVLGPGGFVFVPVGVPHTFSTRGTPARLLAVDSPGGLEGYYEELAAAFPPGTPLDRDRVAEIQRRYDTFPPEG